MNIFLSLIHLKIIFSNIFEKYVCKEMGLKLFGLFGASIFVNWYYFRNFTVIGKNSVSKSIVN